jgi:hypothetical protein
MLKSPFLFLSMASILFSRSDARPRMRSSLRKITAIQSLRESIRMERAHLDSFPEDTAAIRRIGT